MKDVKVYQTVELFDKDEKTQMEQSCFVLATSVEEAIQIIGKDERRELVYVKELCPITRLPNDIYQIELKVPKTSTR